MQTIKVNKTLEDIINEWDNIAELRLTQLTSENDLSHNFILLPTIERQLKNTNTENVLDIGCGIGYDTKKISSFVKLIKGIDISPKSIELAKKKLPNNVSFECISVEEFSKLNINKYTLGIANMVLMTALNANEFIKSVSLILKNDSFFLITITHPWFWAFYWKYVDYEWFDYKKEIQIEANFNISNQKNLNYRTTHIHRPLELYIKLLKENNFNIIEFEEIFPSDNLHKLYFDKWKFPRFLSLKCQLKKTALD